MFDGPRMELKRSLELALEVLWPLASISLTVILVELILQK
jgi:hypothetical protein